ncbi:MAG: hypothetical protein V5B36_05325 [Candidatus Accumulibacter sp. UW25]|jgi:hypothetical protein
MNADSRVSRHSSVAPKIALFRSLFRGREDVYARRFESRRTGKSGYSPACVNEWVRGVCAKPAVKCHDCPHRRFLPLDDETIRVPPAKLQNTLNKAAGSLPRSNICTFS